MRVEITVEMDPFVNPALDGSLTGMRLLRSVRIVNNGETIHDGHLRVVTQPFIAELSTPVDLVVPGGRSVDVDLSDMMDVNPLYLLNLPDSYISKLKVVLYTGDDDIVSESDVYNVRLLTCNTWPACPDKSLLSAFVVPTQPSVVDDVAPLRRSVRNTSSEEVATALVRTIRRKGMTRCEVSGNMFKRPHRFVMYEEMSVTGTCTSLDMALAFSAMVEAIGLRPVIGVFRDGVMTGIAGSSCTGWCDVTPVDPDLIFGGCDPGDIIRMSRGIDKGPLDTLVDVASSRRRVKPIPYRLIGHGTGTYTSSEEVHGEELPLRYVGWLSRLLDISLNNSLLSMGPKVVRMDLGSMGLLEVLQDSLIVGNEFRTRFATDVGDVSEWILGNRLPLGPSDKYAMESIRYSISVNMRETGIKGGSLGLGVVRWRDARGRGHDAPLVLMSVDLRKLNEHSYSLRHPDMEDAMVNIVLLERLRNDRGIRMPLAKEYMLDGRVDMSHLVRILEGIPGIDIQPAVVFGEFGLESNAMWNGLESNSDTILAHPLVSRLSRGEPLDHLGFLEPNPDMEGLHPVLPVDGSQIAAINAAVEGRSFIIRGPPGTGKSQTICNIICELMFRGKTVLFVSQKASALEIIERKLIGIGVGDHCLSIHGRSARRSSVVERLRDLVCRYGSMDADEDVIMHHVDTDALDRYYETMFGSTHGEESSYRIYNRYLASMAVTNVLPRPSAKAMKVFGEDPEVLDSLLSYLPTDDSPSIIPLTDLSESFLSGDVVLDMEAIERAHVLCTDLVELLRRCGMGGDVTLEEVISLTGDMVRSKVYGLGPSDLRLFEERIGRVEGLVDVVERYCDRIRVLDFDSNRDELSKTLTLLDGLLSDMYASCPDRSEIPDVLGPLRDVIARIGRLPKEEQWESFAGGFDHGPVEIAEKVRDSGMDPGTLGAMLRQAAMYIEASYPGMGTDPFVIQDTVHDYRTITGKWDPDIAVSDALVAVSSLRGMMDRVATMVTSIGLASSDWQECPGIHEDRLWFDGWMKRYGKDPALSSVKGLGEFAGNVTTILNLASAYNSALERSNGVWYPEVYDNLDAFMSSLMGLEDHGLKNLINGNRHHFMKAIERCSRIRMRFNEVRGRLDMASAVRRNRDVIRDLIVRYGASLSILSADADRFERLCLDVERAQDNVPDWRRLRDEGILDDDGRNRGLGRLCKGIGSVLKDMDLVSWERGSIDMYQLPLLCDRIASDMALSREQDSVDGICRSIVGSILDAVSGIMERMCEIREALVSIHPDRTSIPMGCILMLMDDSDRILSTASSCRESLVHYDSIVGGDLRSDRLCISEVADRSGLLIFCQEELRNVSALVERLCLGGNNLRRYVIDALIHHPVSDVVASLERWFLGNILDIRMGKAFGIENYGRGTLPDYEEEVRRSYDSMYECNRDNLARVLASRAVKVSADPSLRMLLSKDIPLSGMLDSMSGALQTLVPCMVMNVKSVSRFLGDSSLTFDYVIFDESSQIPVADSISSLSKGDACIIVGDTNQLPPTRFFRNNVDNQQEGEIESILEECIFDGMPSLELEWHYRSNHESLIAYSNSRFYDNRLITFPSVSDRVSMVEFRHVPGAVYLRGEGRNPVEAEAVVDEIYRICSEPSYSGQSIGVVTFGTSQKDEVESALARRQERMPLRYTNRREPLSIGNLESVQGEERSIMILSVGYGRDVDGKLSMNFGPLNQGRGWRRLNVAISRARDRMIVFSSMLPSDIRVGENTGRGVRELKGFLEYARNGRFDRKVMSADIIDPLLPDVARVVEGMGYETSLNIGKSELRIDVAVVDPKDPDRYCLAILLDRNLYDNSRNSVDRDYTKVRFLRKMGWKVLRVHTIDWMMDRDATVKRIVDALPRRG